MKKILFGSDARKKIKAGIDKCVDVVKVSMGGNGKNVLIYNGHTSEVINDGVSIAREVNVKDEIEQAGIQLAKQCSQQTNRDAGDGTTTTLVLLQSILNEIIQDFQTENPREVREQLIKEAKEVLDKCKVNKVEKKEQLYNIALTSSLNEEIAKTISDIYWELGKDAKITIEEMSKDILESEIVKGMQFESKKADIIKQEGKRLYEDIDAIVVDKVETPQDIEEKVAEVVKKGKSALVVISNGFTRSVLISMQKSTGFTFIPLEYKNLKSFDDLKAYIGDKPLDRVIVDDEQTTIIGGKGDVSETIKALKAKLGEEKSEYEKEDIQKRIASLSSGIGIIKVGRATEVEANEYVLKVEDAIGACKGALEEGYVLGAGLALKNASESNSERIKAICEAPYRQICENAGTQELEVPESVIDSYKTVKHSLLNAISTATSILTVEAALIEEKDED